MGWLFTHRDRGQTHEEWFRRQWGQEFSDKVIAFSTKNNVMYCVLEVDAAQEPRCVPDENGKVRVALVYLLKWVPRDWYNFGYKDMDEFMGPCEARCPLKILDMLSPLDPDKLAEAQAKRAAAEAKGEWLYDGILSAHDWREASRRYSEGAKNLKVGESYKLNQTLYFGGVPATHLKLIERKGRRLRWAHPAGFPVRLRQDFDFSKIEPLNG